MRICETEKILRDKTEVLQNPDICELNDSNKFHAWAFWKASSHMSQKSTYRWLTDDFKFSDL